MKSINYCYTSRILLANTASDIQECQTLSFHEQRTTVTCTLHNWSLAVSST